MSLLGDRVEHPLNCRSPFLVVGRVGEQGSVLQRFSLLGKLPLLDTHFLLNFPDRFEQAFELTRSQRVRVALERYRDLL